MARLPLFEREEFVERFRPHPLAYFGRHLGAFVWLVPGAVGSILATSLSSPRAAAWGAITFALLCFVGGAAHARLSKRRMRLAWVGVLFGCAFVVVDLLAKPEFPMAAGAPLALGLLVCVLNVAFNEVDRWGRTHFLTSERLVVRGGIGNRVERTLPFADIQEVRGERGIVGRWFDYGDLTLVLARGSRAGKVPENAEVLAGIAHFERVKHLLDTALMEARLPSRERERRRDERRLKESMRTVAKWAGPGRSDPPPP